MSAAGIRPETRPDLRLLITKMPGGFLPIPAPELPTNCQQSWTVRAETSDTSPPGGRPFFSFKKKKKGHLGNLTLLTLMPSQACHVSSRCWRETVRGKLILINSWVCSWGQRGTEIDFTSCCSGFKNFIKKKEKRKKKKAFTFKNSPVAELYPGARLWQCRPESGLCPLCTGLSAPKCPAWRYISEASQPVEGFKVSWHRIQLGSNTLKNNQNMLSDVKLQLPPSNSTFRKWTS